MSYRRFLPISAAALALAITACAAKAPSTRTTDSSPGLATKTATSVASAASARSAVTNASAAYRPVLADRIVVKKSERRLYLMRAGQPFRSYTIALGYQPTGHKRYRGDGRTPEGRYLLDWRSAKSNYRKALHISYPNAQDLMRAMRQGQDPGGAIMIHGQPSRRGEPKTGDWTFGCIAVSNMAIDEIWGYTEVGTPVEILP